MGVNKGRLWWGDVVQWSRGFWDERARGRGV